MAGKGAVPLHGLGLRAFGDARPRANLAPYATPSPGPSISMSDLSAGAAVVGLGSNFLGRLGDQAICKALDEFDQNTPIGGVADFSKGDDEPQAFDDGRFHCREAVAIAVPGEIGSVDVHRARSGRS